MDDNSTLLIVVLIAVVGLALFLRQPQPKPKADPWATLGASVGSIVGGFI